MKYKVGDFVRIQSYDWYKKNNIYGTVICGLLHFDSLRTKYCGNVMTIAFADSKGHYRMKEDDGLFLWNNDMIIGLAEDTMKSPVELLAELWRKVDKEKQGMDEKTKRMLKNWEHVFPCPSGYEFRDENGNVINATKIVLEKKKKEYPKTYEECCKVLGIEGGRLMFNNSGITQYERELYIKMNNLSKLIICRDAYWKIAGEEMGLGKPWEPDYDSGVDKFGIICMNGVIQESNPTTYWERHLNKVLDFPSKEMRDAFKESEEISKLIKECKELL